MGYFLKISAISIALVFIAAACGSDSSDESATSASAAAPTYGCPERVIVQTDWFPQPEHGYLYQIIGTDGNISASNGRYSGTIPGTGLTLEVRAGGPYLGTSDPATEFYSDRDIFMAYVDTSTAIESYRATPVVAVFANFEIGPQVLYWDPDTYTFESFEDIGRSGATVLHFPGANYIKFLIAKGLVDAENTDGSYTGSPDRFISSGGTIVQQGFATNEPYRYENEFTAWGKPVESLLIHDSGHEIYQSAISVKPETIETHAECLGFLVPLMQQALKDHISNPEPIDIKLVEIVEELDSFWTATAEGHAWSSEQMRSRGLVTDGDNGYVGDMDEARIQRLIDDLSPIYASEGTDGFGSNDPPLQASDVFTNRFIDTSISLGF